MYASFVLKSLSSMKSKLYWTFLNIFTTLAMFLGQIKGINIIFTGSTAQMFEM